MGDEGFRTEEDTQQFLFVLKPRLCIHGPDFGPWKRDGDEFKARVIMESHALEPGETQCVRIETILQHARDLESGHTDTVVGVDKMLEITITERAKGKTLTGDWLWAARVAYELGCEDRLRA